MKLVMVTGMSGAGKSTAMKMMEDMGFFCVDNLPIALFQKFMEFAKEVDTPTHDIALGIDIRSGGDDFAELYAALDAIKEQKLDFEILFLDADDEVLIKRYKETRRIHPLAKQERIKEGLAQEREKIACLKERADYILDTSTLLTRELKTELERIFIKNEEFKSLFITILSFGFKYGIPSDSDLVLDVRFLPNPYYDAELRPKTGNDVEIQEFVMRHADTKPFLEKLEDFIKFLIPRYIAEGKTQLVISIGCTGGKHRSVVLANALYQCLEGGKEYGLKIEHRDITKDALRGK